MDADRDTDTEADSKLGCGYFPLTLATFFGPAKGIPCFVLLTTHAPMRICYRRHARVTGNGVLASITSVTGKCRV